MSRFLLLMLAMLMLTACHDDLLTEATHQPTYELNDSTSFSLGTLLRGHHTSTQKLMLYNRNAGEIALESISLRGGDSSLFRINVDGMAGTMFSNQDLLHIAEDDSLCILVEAAFDQEQDERDVLREDYIDIRCNQRLTSIRLTVTTRDVEELWSCQIAHDTLWAAGDLDKLIIGDLTVMAGATLTVDSGVTLYLHDHANLLVYGSLVLSGTLNHPVVLMGDRTDRIFDNLYYRDMPSQWGGVHLFPGSADSRFTYAEIRGMTSGIVLEQEVCNTRFYDEKPVVEAPADAPSVMPMVPTS